MKEIDGDAVLLCRLCDEGVDILVARGFYRCRRLQFGLCRFRLTPEPVLCYVASTARRNHRKCSNKGGVKCLAFLVRRIHEGANGVTKCLFHRLCLNKLLSRLVGCFKPAKRSIRRDVTENAAALCKLTHAFPAEEAPEQPL